MTQFSVAKSQIVTNGIDSANGTVSIDRCDPANFDCIGVALDRSVVPPQPLPDLLGAPLGAFCPTNPGTQFQTQTFPITATWLVSQATPVTVTAYIPAPNAPKFPVTINLQPDGPTMTLSPTTLINGTGQTATGAIIFPFPVYGPARNLSVTSDSDKIQVAVGPLHDGDTSARLTVTQSFPGNPVTVPTVATITANESV